MKLETIAALCVSWLALTAVEGRSQAKIPPYDMWTSDVQAAIRDRSTLEMEIAPQITSGYSDVFFHLKSFGRLVRILPAI